MDLAFTFGIITDASPEALARLRVILAGIEAQRIPDYEVLIVGNVPPEFSRRKNTRLIPFDESAQPRWITRKKNLITQSANHDNIVYMHDYLQLDPGWYAGWQSFGDNFAACMNPIINIDGSRYRDWSLFYDAATHAARDYAGVGAMENLLPYSERSLSKAMYFSGAYWVAKRRVMLDIPLDERLTWGQGEDVIWSHRFRAAHAFSINPHSPVRLLGKKKDPIFREILPQKLDLMKTYFAAHPPEPGYGCSDDLESWRAHGHFGSSAPAIPRTRELAGQP